MNCDASCCTTLHSNFTALHYKLCCIALCCVASFTVLEILLRYIVTLLCCVVNSTVVHYAATLLRYTQILLHHYASSFVTLHCEFCCTSSSIDPSSNNMHTQKQWLTWGRSHTQKQKWTRRNCTPTKTRGAKPLEPHRTLAPWKTCEQAREHQKRWVKARHCSLEKNSLGVLFCRS